MLDQSVVSSGPAKGDNGCGGSTKALDLYLGTDRPVVHVDRFEDDTAGIYPCYYARTGDGLVVGTNVVRVVEELGDLQYNRSFRPPVRKIAAGRKEGVVRGGMVGRVAKGVLGRVVPGRAPRRWYGGWDTIDKRVMRLRPFESIHDGEAVVGFRPTFSLSDPEEFVERSARHIRRFINRVERAFPDHHHVALVGGKDSQLILLAPKVSERWHAFSAHPNHPLVSEFIRRNDLKNGRFFTHDGSYDETKEYIVQMLAASDIMVDPRHSRWGSVLERIKNELGGKVIFWAGTAGGAFNRYVAPFHGSGDYFGTHFTRAASWQAIGAQSMRNRLGCLRLSPYHSSEIWDEVYRHYDPGMLKPGMDLRPRIAQALLGREVWFPEANPGPDSVVYPFPLDLRKEYLGHIQRVLEARRGPHAEGVGLGVGVRGVGSGEGDVG